MNLMPTISKPMISYGQRYAWTVMEPVDQLLEAVRAIRQAPFDKFDQLINPFESKFVWKNKFQFPTPVELLIQEMENSVDKVGELFGVGGLKIDDPRHYTGVFKYPKDGYLSAHVDAGIHPITGERKHVTMLLYIGGNGHSGGELELWSGDSASKEDPQLSKLIATLNPVHGMVVLFENNDFAWHSAASNEGEQDRLVLTVSFLSDQVDAFENKRQRAFFVPRPGEEWSEEAKELRRKRSDSSTAHEVYRAGVING